MKCAYRLCGVDVQQPEKHRGPSKKYCCRKHSKAERGLRREERMAQAEADRERRRVKAKQYATINCTKWRECLSKAIRSKKGDMECLDCDDMEMQKNAYLRELGTEIFGRDAGRYPLNLPK